LPKPPEGDADAVGELTKCIAAEARHTDLRVVVEREVRARLYPAWSMGLLYDSDVADQLEDLFCSASLDQDRGTHLMLVMKADSVMGPL
jgi:hypothetical protein